MKHLSFLCAIAFVVVSCGVDEGRPSASMAVEVSALSLSTNDTLVLTRALANSGRQTLWLNATAHGYAMRNGAGQPVCAVDTTVTNAPLELVRILPDSAVVVEHSYALANMADCVPGTYQIEFHAFLHKNDSATDAPFTLRTGASTFVLTAP